MIEEIQDLPDNVDPEQALGDLLQQANSGQLGEPPPDPLLEPKKNAKGGVWKDPKENTPDPDHPKYQELYKENKKNKTLVDDLSKKLEQVIDKFDKVFTHNQTMAQEIVKMSQGQQQIQQETKYSTEMSRLNEQLQALEDKRVTHQKQFEHEEANRISDQIYGLKQQIQKIEAERIAGVPSQQPETPQVPQMKPEDYDRFQRINQWAKSIPWIENMAEPKNPEAFAYARSVGAVLAADPDWKNKPEEEHLKEIQRQTEARFGFSKQPQPQGFSGGVEGVTNVGDMSQGIPGQLDDMSRNAIQIAKMYGIDVKPDEYNAHAAYLGN